MRILKRVKVQGHHVGERRRSTSRLRRRLLSWTLIIVGLMVGAGAATALAAASPSASGPVVPVTTGSPVTVANPAFVIWEVSASHLKATHADGQCVLPPLAPPAAGDATVAWVRTGSSLGLSCLRLLRSEVRLLAVGPSVNVSGPARRVVSSQTRAAHQATRRVPQPVGSGKLLRTHVAQLRAASLTDLLEQLRGRPDAEGRTFNPATAVVSGANYRAPVWHWHPPDPIGIVTTALLVAGLGFALTSARWALAVGATAVVGLAVAVLSASIGVREDVPAVALCGAVGLCAVTLVLAGAWFGRRARASAETPGSLLPAISPAVWAGDDWSPSNAANGDSSGSPTPIGQPARAGRPASSSVVTGPVNTPGGPGFDHDRPVHGGRPVLTLSSPKAPSPTTPYELVAAWPSADAVGEPPSGARNVSSPARIVTVSDSACDGLSIAGLEIRAAAVRGLSHRWSGRPRQDAFSFGVDATGHHLVLAVADGVGSAPHAEIGAQLAVHHAVDLLTRDLNRGVTLADLDGADLMARVATLIRVGSPFPDDEQIARLVATTLVVALVETTSRLREHRVWLAQVGNSEAIVLHEGVYRYLNEVVDGEIADTRVNSVPMRPDSVEERCSLIPAGSVLFLCSDGVSDPLGHGRGSVGAYLAERLAVPPDPLELARTLGFLRKGFFDDRVLAGVWL